MLYIYLLSCSLNMMVEEVANQLRGIGTGYYWFWKSMAVAFGLVALIIFDWAGVFHQEPELPNFQDKRFVLFHP